jgi:hypothetical protein
MNASRAKPASIFAAVAILAIPASATAAAYVPPGNSAATQYTEAVPTAGGPKATGNSKHRQSSTPDKVLGKRNAERLDAQGQAGKEAAEVAAATAPDTETGSGGASQGNGAAGTGDTADSKPQGGAGSPNRQGDGASSATARSSDPDGSSALGEVASQVTGSSSSGGIGLLLPLAIVAAVAGAIAYLVRQRRRPAS